jgi:hypothetical protein
VGVWRPRSLCRLHLPRRRTTQAARLTPSTTYRQARDLARIWRHRHGRFVPKAAVSRRFRLDKCGSSIH